MADLSDIATLQELRSFLLSLTPTLQDQSIINLTKAVCFYDFLVSLYLSY